MNFYYYLTSLYSIHTIVYCCYPIIAHHRVNKILTGKAENRLESIMFSLEIHKIPIKQDSAVSLSLLSYYMVVVM